jgi:hypothetical protein
MSVTQQATQEIQVKAKAKAITFNKTTFNELNNQLNSECKKKGSSDRDTKRQKGLLAEWTPYFEHLKAITDFIKITKLNEREQELVTQIFDARPVKPRCSKFIDDSLLYDGRFINMKIVNISLTTQLEYITKTIMYRFNDNESTHDFIRTLRSMLNILVQSLPTRTRLVNILLDSEERDRKNYKMNHNTNTNININSPVDFPNLSGNHTNMFIKKDANIIKAPTYNNFTYNTLSNNTLSNNTLSNNTLSNNTLSNNTYSTIAKPILNNLNMQVNQVNQVNKLNQAQLNQEDLISDVEEQYTNNESDNEKILSETSLLKSLDQASDDYNSFNKIEPYRETSLTETDEPLTENSQDSQNLNNFNQASPYPILGFKQIPNNYKLLDIFPDCSKQYEKNQLVAIMWINEQKSIPMLLPHLFQLSKNDFIHLPIHNIADVFNNNPIKNNNLIAAMWMDPIFNTDGHVEISGRFVPIF